MFINFLLCILMHSLIIENYRLKTQDVKLMSHNTQDECWDGNSGGPRSFSS